MPTVSIQRAETLQLLIAVLLNVYRLNIKHDTHMTHSLQTQTITVHRRNPREDFVNS